MADIRKAMQRTMNWEGLLSNHKADRGGLTYKGVARKANPNWKGWDIIDSVLDNSLSLKEQNNILEQNTELQKLVIDVYKKEYWNAMRGDEIKSQRVANELFDLVVNHGVGGGIKIIQKTAKLPETGKMNSKLLNYLNSLK